MEKECLNCKIKFNAKPCHVRQKFCSKKCKVDYYKKNGNNSFVSKKCLECDKTFFISPSKINTCSFCSRICQGKYKTKFHDLNKTKICKFCHEKFVGWSKNDKFCSLKCSVLGKTYHGRKCGERIIFQCDICGKEIRQTYYRSKLYAHHFCSYECLYKAESNGIVKLPNSGRFGYRIDLNDGNNYRSSLEADYARYLNYLNKKFIFEGKTFELEIGGKKKFYTPDFFIIDENKYIETKGYVKGIDNSFCVELLKQQGINIEIIKMNDFSLLLKETGLNKVIENIEILNYKKTKHLILNPDRLIPIESISCINKEIEMYDIEIENENNFFVSNGQTFVCTHNSKMPDIDLDFESDKRDTVMQYIIETYGKENVAPIANYSLMSIKSGLKDACRGYDIPFQIANELTIEMDKNDEDFESESNQLIFNNFLKNHSEYTEHLQKAISLCKELMGQVRHIGKHAAGLLITNNKIYDYCPMYHLKDMCISGYDKDIIDDIKLLKIDILGLTELSNMQYVKRVINDEYKIDFNIMEYTMHLLNTNQDITKYLNFIKNGNSYGIFQFGTSAMKGLIEEYKDKMNSFDDFVVLSSLARPGAKNFLPTYFENKGKEELQSIDPLIAKYFEKTYQTPVYQEQLINVLSFLTGETIGHADIMRRGLENKDEKVLKNIKEKTNERFKSIGPERIEKMLNFIYNSCAYLFNKSHAVAYTIISLATIVSKYIFPYETYISFLNNKDKDEQEAIIFDMIYNKVKFIVPSIGYSQFNSVIIERGIRGERTIVVGLKTIKGLAERKLEKLSLLDTNSSYLESKIDKIVKDKIFKLYKLDEMLSTGKQIDYIDNLYDILEFDTSVLKYTPYALDYQKESNDYYSRIVLFNGFRKTASGKSYRTNVTILNGESFRVSGEMIAASKVTIYINSREMEDFKCQIKNFIKNKNLENLDKFTESTLENLNILAKIDNRQFTFFEPKADNKEQRTFKLIYISRFLDYTQIFKAFRIKEKDFSEEFEQLLPQKKRKKSGEEIPTE